MITESIVIKGMWVFSLALTPTEKWKAAGSFRDSTSTKGLLTLLVVIALIIAVIVLFWVLAKYKRSNLKIAKSTATNEKLQQEISELKPKGI